MYLRIGNVFHKERVVCSIPVRVLVAYEDFCTNHHHQEHLKDSRVDMANNSDFSIKTNEKT